jgi:hypothetical protein
MASAECAGAGYEGVLIPVHAMYLCPVLYRVKRVGNVARGF